jgi:hypothetical protein
MRWSWALLIAAVVLGCGDDDAYPVDAGAGVDSGGGRDGGQPDGGQLDGGQLDGATATDAGASALSVVVTNVTEGETLPHPIALLVGTADAAGSEITIGTDAEALPWPLDDGRFTAMVRLAPGDNEITFAAEGRADTFSLRYEPQDNPRFVRLIYILAADGDGSFQGPPAEPADQASAIARIALAGEMLQTFVAESMVREGHGRRTFRLVTGTDGRPEVLVHRSSLTTAEAHAEDGLALWSHFYGEFGGLPDRGISIDVAVMAFSRYDATRRTLRGHTALGGGRLGLFGSASLHTWAESLDQVTERFTDETVVDGTLLHDDSAGRQRYWSNYATTLGATIHELGHCLSLPHPRAGSTIMSRGFDYINRWFVGREPASATSRAIESITPDNQPGWHDGNAARLRYHRFLELRDVAHASNVAPSFSRDAHRIVVSSGSGLRQIAHHVNGDIADFVHYPDSPPMEHIVDLAAARAAYGAGANLRITAIDDEGNIGESGEAPL